MYKLFLNSDILLKTSSNSNSITSSSYSSSVITSSSDPQFRYIQNTLFSGSIIKKSTDNTAYTGSITVVTCPRSVFKNLVLIDDLTINNGGSAIFTYNSSSKYLSNTNIKLKNSVLISGSNVLIGSLINPLGTLVLYGNYNTVSVVLSKNKEVLYNDIYFSRLLSQLMNLSTNPSWDSTVQYTYITTIGLYDLNNNLLAVGRLNKPVRKDNETECSFKVKIIK